MMNESTRREFLKGTALMGLAATAAGCQLGIPAEIVTDLDVRFV